MKLVYILQWSEDALAGIKDRHPDVTFVQATTTAEAARELADADVLVVNGPNYINEVSKAAKTNAPKLRWIQSSSIGTDKFEAEGVPETATFTTSAGLKGRTVGEHGMALLFGYVHALPQIERHRAANYWGRTELRSDVDSVEGKTMLLLGYGSIGKEIARKAKAFDMHVIALNRSGAGDGDADTLDTIDRMSDYLADADFIMSTLPLTDETHHLIAAKEFAAMKRSAVILNVGRGPVISHAALVQALKDGQIAGAALDVFEAEPLPLDDPLWAMPNVIISPHVAGTGGPLVLRFQELVSENLTRFKAGEPLINVEKVG